MKVQILDSTLREGEQTPGVSFNIRQKLEIARLLDEFGVDIIEAGHPAVSPDIMNGVKAITAENLDAEILAHSRALLPDVDMALDSGADWIGIFFSVSDRSLEERFRKSIGDATAVITKAIEYAKDHGLRVRYTPEDTVRSNFTTVIQVAKAAVEAGADRISIADTSGIMTPLKMYDFISRFKEEVHAPLNVHCHNDLGMAVANSLTAVEAGVTVVDTCVNGLGERTGIAPLAELCTALRLVYKNNEDWNMNLIPKLSKTVAKYSGIRISPLAPIVGENAFSHCAGLHTAAVLMNPEHYESIPSDMVGRKRKIVIDKFAGKAAIQYKLQQLRISPTEKELDSLLNHIKSNGYNMLGDTELLSIMEKIRQENRGLLWAH
ncbi:MAG: homocitrate synthase [archaeon]